MRTNRGLKKQFNVWNKKYFGGKLPKGTEVIYADGRFDKEFAERRSWLMYGSTYRFVDDAPLIAINKKLQTNAMWTQVSLTLLHEMVHLSNWRFNHGEKFRARFKELIAKGALDADL